MKLLLFIPTLAHGGAERVMINLAKNFSEEGCEVIFLLENEAENEYPLPQGVSRIQLNYNEQYPIILKHLCGFRAFFKAVNKIKPDIMLSFLVRPNLYSAIYKLFHKKQKVYVSVRNTPEFEYPNRIKQYLALKLFPKVDGVILQTNDVNNWFSKEKSRINSAVIPNQVADEFFDKSFNGERKNIVNVGRLEYQKNQELLIRAFAKIADKTDENLIIYGQGKLKEKLCALISELKLEKRVFLGGLIEDVSNTIIGSRLFVMSSDFEGSPNALLEAIALGIPSISTDCPCGGPKEIITEGENGFLVPVGDADALAEKMLYALSLSEEETEKISKNAKKSAERYRPEKVFEQWKNFLSGERFKHF